MGTVAISTRIHINCSPEVLFACISDPALDARWRKEVQRCDVFSPTLCGAEHVQYSYLTKKMPHYAQRFVCTCFEPNHRVVFETVPGSAFPQRSERVATANGVQGVAFVYHLEFDSGIVSEALGFSLPQFLIRWAAKRDAQRYLKVLKAHLENRV